MTTDGKPEQLTSTCTSTVLVGASSWSERTLVHESGWYPRRSMKAAERIAYYASRLSLVEIDATARFPPTPDLSRQWVERTPPGFTIDVQAWSLLTGGAALPDSLWDDVRDEVRPELRDRRRLYLSHLTAAGQQESWARFRHALAPLHESGRLGAVLFRYPRWLQPGATARSLMRNAREALADYPLAVELAHPRWTHGRGCEETLGFLEDEQLGFVCVDGLGAPPVVATTTDLAVVRLHGDNFGDGEEPYSPVAERRANRYSTEELARWVPRIRELADVAAQVHVVFANTFRDHAVSNAAELDALLRFPSLRFSSLPSA